MNLEKLANLMSHASKDDENNIEVLKRELKNNDFKLCGMGVDIMIGMMEDMGLDEDAAIYWKTLGLTHLPYNPANALAE